MIINAPIKRIQHNPWQTRHGEPQPEYIKELALDIATNGLLQTPLGRLVDSEGAAVEVAWPDTVIEMKFHEGDGLQVQLAFGHNRLAAFRWLYDLKDHSDIETDYSHLPVDLRQLTDEQMAIMAWSENEKRRDVTAIERAWAIQQRIKDFGWSNRECAEALGIDHSTVANILRLLKLPDDIQQQILQGVLTERQAQALLPLYDAPIDLEFAPNSYYYEGPRVILRDAAKNSSDHIRSQVSNYLDGVSKDLSHAEFKLDQLLPEEGGIYCGMCSTCDKRMASRNRCFNEMCFNAKTAYIHRKYLEKASFSSGYGILDEHKAGKAKMDAEKKADEYKQQLEEHLYRCIAEYQSPGALYAAVKHYMHPLDSELVLEKIWRYLAFEATRTIMPIQFNNEPDLVSRINQNLDYLKIPHLGSSDDDKQPEVDFPVF